MGIRTVTAGMIKLSWPFAVCFRGIKITGLQDGLVMELRGPPVVGSLAPGLRHHRAWEFVL